MSKPDVWMPLYVADYLADTAHLSVSEHGAYLLLIMHYWRNGGLPSDDVKLARITKCQPKEWARIRATIAEFFDADWRHVRIDRELAAAAAAAERARQNGKRGGRPRKENPDVTQKEPNPFENKTQTITQTKPRHEPKPNPEKSSSPSPSPSPIPSISSTDVLEIPLPTKSQGSRLASDWQPTAEERDYAATLGLDPERQAQDFREYWLARVGAAARKADWHLTWQTWCRRSADFARDRATPGHPRFDINTLLTKGSAS